MARGCDRNTGLYVGPHLCQRVVQEGSVCGRERDLVELVRVYSVGQSDGIAGDIEAVDQCVNIWSADNLQVIAYYLCDLYLTLAVLGQEEDTLLDVLPGKDGGKPVLSGGGGNGLEGLWSRSDVLP